MKGAPLRFVAGVVGGWTCIRLAMLLPAGGPLEIAADVLAPAAATGRREVAPPTPSATPTKAGGVRGSPPVARRPMVDVRPRAAKNADASVARELLDAVSPTPATVDEASPVLIPPNVGVQPAGEPKRLAVGAWLLARGGANGTLSGGMLGASQAGARVTYAIDTARRIALSARVAAPLRGRGAEAAVGIDWQPTRAPVHLLAEQRFGLDGARGGPTVMAVAGLNPTPIAAGFRLEAYAQGGAILRGGRAEAFGDGAARLTRPVLAIGGTRLDAGAGAWAAGQRGAARVDVGPTVGLALPIAGRQLRLSADWRQRIAGDARPGSGPALSIGTDF